MNAETKNTVLSIVLAPLCLLAFACVFLQYANWLFVVILGAIIANSNLIKRHPLISDFFWFTTLFLIFLDTALAVRIGLEGLYFSHSISKALAAVSSSLHMRLIPFGWLPKILAYVFMFLMGLFALFNRYFPLKESDDPLVLSKWSGNYILISFAILATVIAFLAPTYYPMKG